MKNLIKHIPKFLILSRIGCAVFIFVSCISGLHRTYIIPVSIYAILSDLFDGIIARRIGISSKELRVMDTKADTVFWFSCLFALCTTQRVFLMQHIWQVAILFFSELFIIALGNIRFRERISFHTILSKFWAVLLLWFFIDIMLDSSAALSFGIAFWVGILAQAEIILIACLLRHPVTDVPSLRHVGKLNRGEAIRRSKWFNG